jgi:hypothetical protein
MPDLEPFSERPNRWPLSLGQALNRKQKLVLLRFETRSPCLALTVGQEATDPIPNFGKGVEVNCGFHIVER